MLNLSVPKLVPLAVMRELGSARLGWGSIQRRS